MHKRYVFLDTETTGLSPHTGHKIVEIAMLEVVDNKETGKFLHHYINPEMSMPKEAFNVHGISDELLSDKLKICDVIQEVRDFIGDDKIVAHNATFDVNFLNYEFSNHNLNTISDSNIIDTLKIAKSKYPNNKNNLDSLANRLNVSLEERKEYHGALVDTKILYQVYRKMQVSQSKLIADDLNRQDSYIVNNSNLCRNLNISDRSNHYRDNDTLIKYNEFLAKYSLKDW